jgi:phosphoribosylglycinamide formyltransferase-1
MLNGCKKSQRTAIFISGGGSTLQALLDVQHLLNIGLVVSNNLKAPGLKKAQRFGCQVLVVNRKTDFNILNTELNSYRIERIFLAGFMKILPPDFVEIWKGRILNIHPSMLPLYPGLQSAEKSWQDGASMGVTIHQVSEEVDAGQVFRQQRALEKNRLLSWPESVLFLRRTEQHLLRETAMRLL